MHKICFITHPYSARLDTGRGIDKYAYEISRNVSRIIDKKKLDLSLEILSEGVDLGDIETRKKWTLLSTLQKYVLKYGMRFPYATINLAFKKADLCHAVTDRGATMAISLKKSPVVVTIHDMLPFEQPKPRNPIYRLMNDYRRFCTRMSVEKSDAIILPFNYTKEKILSLFDVDGAKIHIINYGVDHDFYYPRAVRESRVKKVLYVGEVIREKGVDSLISAFSIVEKGVDNVELLIGGLRSDDQLFLERLTKDLGLKKVDFLGYIPEDKLPHIYSSADVMVYPSRVGFGLSTIEAMACGTPVIVGASFDAKEFVGDSGILVDPKDIEQLADAIIKILTDIKLRNNMSNKAIKRSKQFSWENAAERTIQVYLDVLSRR